MDFAYSPRFVELQARVRHFLEAHIVPRHAAWLRSVEEGVFPPPFVDELKALAREEGLWNLFLPGLHDDEPGVRLSNLEYAPLAEIMGRIPGRRRSSTARPPTPATWSFCICSPRPSRPSAG